MRQPLISSDRQVGWPTGLDTIMEQRNFVFFGSARNKQRNKQ